MNIKDLYILGPEKIEYRVSKQFPKVNRVGIFLSGGMESTLLSLIAFEIYGEDNVLLFYSDNLFSTKRKIGNENIEVNIEKSRQLLQKEIIYVEIDYDSFIKDRQRAIIENVNHIKEKFNVGALIFGFTELFFEVEIFRQKGLSVEGIKSIAFNSPEKYKRTIEEFHLETDQYTKYLLDINIAPEAYKVLKDRSIISAPFDCLNKSEVVDLYQQLGFLIYLFRTTSCVTGEIKKSGKHCGHCFNCQQRYDAFRILGGITDQTEYASNLIKDRRKKLEELREA